jgi:hypothetical protein
MRYAVVKPAKCKHSGYSAGIKFIQLLTDLNDAFIQRAYYTNIYTHGKESDCEGCNMIVVEE